MREIQTAITDMTDQKFAKVRKEFTDLKTMVEVKQAMVDMKLDSMNDIRDNFLSMERSFKEGEPRGAIKSSIEALSSEIESLKRNISDTQALSFKYNKDSDQRLAENGSKL